eukprot:COSAG05_NODE_15017_length_380_cov_1.209964_1_plen_84_part_01
MDAAAAADKQLSELLRDLDDRCPERWFPPAGLRPAEVQAMAAKTLGRPLRPEEFDVLWARLDTNGDGVIDHKELAAAAEKAFVE